MFIGVSEDFDAFYLASARRVVAYVYALCGDLAEAQDVTQEAFARAWQRWPKLSRYDDPEAWVRTVAWRLAANWWRTNRRRLRYRRLVATEAARSGPSPDRVALTQAFRRLPEAQRRVVVLHYIYDLPVAQIAIETGMPAGTVKVYLARGRAALAALLGDSDDEAEEYLDVIASS